MDPGASFLSLLENFMGGRGGSCSESVPEYEPVSNLKCATGTVTVTGHAMPRVLTKHVHSAIPSRSASRRPRCVSHHNDCHDLRYY